jgi:hypothetical protein
MGVWVSMGVDGGALVEDGVGVPTVGKAGDSRLVFEAVGDGDRATAGTVAGVEGARRQVVSDPTTKSKTRLGEHRVRKRRRVSKE